MDNFRYLISVQEKSERVLELTETLIKLNPGHYTVWYILFFNTLSRVTYS